MSDKSKKREDITVDGVRAIELMYRAIRRTDNDVLAFYRTNMRMNSPSMGTMMPDRYQLVLDSTERCISVFKLAMIQLMQASEKFSERGIDFSWCSIYMPLMLLRKNDCQKTVSEIISGYSIFPENICFELPLSLLDEEDGRCAESIKNMRKRGFHFMLPGVGGDGFPLMKLADFELDYVLLDNSLTDMLGVSERSDLCIKSIISFISELDAEPVADGVLSSAQAEKLYDLDCSFYTGDYAGKYMLERFIRKKSES